MADTTARLSGTTRVVQRKSGLKLSWPHPGDKRRAAVGESPAVREDESSTRAHVTRIIPVLQRDMEMHYQLTRPGTNGPTPPTVDVPLEFNPTDIKLGDQDLLQHFQLAASRSLAIFSHEPAELGNALIRIALAGNTASAKAVLQSLLAFSSLHRQDVHVQAVELKITAIRALGVASSSSNIGRTESVQHVASGMLLLSFEIQQASCTSGDWTWYLRGVKDVIRAAGLAKGYQENSDLAILLDWVYYHDVLARFNLQHWRRESAGDSPPLGHPCIAPSSPGSSTITNTRAEISQSAPPAFSLIQLLSEVCDAVAQPPADMSAKDAQDHKNFINILDWRIRSLNLAAIAGDDSADTHLFMELYQLAILVYLNRMSETNQGARTQRQIDGAFGLLSRLPSCERQFPVFILGCEARSDDQRAVVLDLIAKTEKGVASRSFNHVRLLLEAIWAQDDLADRPVYYGNKLSYVISRTRIMPTWV